MLEIYAQSFDFAAIYTVYFTILISVSLQGIWIMTAESAVLQSYIGRIPFHLPSSETIRKYNTEIGLKLFLVILRTVRKKLDPGEDAFSFSSNFLN
ncbi:hypothetical protein [Bacillus sp. T33-2]|uniref:hypothetical protein n=1 Tax=Bacillus sp. T33-2 TaxID=2054168 RepID=UPI000C776095|nr:hypothetical protein [Bacillus sp. T33-2]PLR98796.1 hypothetical protein CVD19_03940 [Bacillus sp. T33-2]